MPIVNAVNYKPRKLSDILSEDAFGYSEDPVGPPIEDDSAAYDQFLQSGEAARTREEKRATDNIMEGLQSRGLARSGIALKDVIEQVLGPSTERAGSMAATFGLERARNRSSLLENERNRAADLNSQKLGGRISSILGYDQGMTSLEAADRAEAANARLLSQQNRSARRNALLSGLSSGVGAYLGKKF